MHIGIDLNMRNRSSRQYPQSSFGTLFEKRLHAREPAQPANPSVKAS